MDAKSNIVLVVTKDAASRGGVAGYYNLFLEKVGECDLKFERFTIGSRSTDYYHRRFRPIRYAVTYISDVFRFAWRLARNRRIQCVLLNPSLIPVPLFRDAILLLISKRFRRKAVVFVRGWRDDVAETINNRPWFRRAFISTYKNADQIIVLAGEFRDQLERIGIPKHKIIVSRTMFDGDLVQPRSKMRSPVLRFLFLSRISHKKGVFEIVNAAEKLKGAGLQFSVSIHGHGAELDTIANLEERAIALDVDDHVEIGNFLEGEDKYRAYAGADVFLLPSHHEGCPNSVLEAMASGCFIICTGAGAMKEVVVDGVNGSIIRVDDLQGLTEKMAWTIKNRDSVCRIGKANRSYAFEKFESALIINQIVDVHRSLLQ